MKKRDVKYPIELVVLLLCDKWKFIILCKLRKKTLRFGELQEQIGNISSKVLTDQLKTLEMNGFIDRKVFSEEIPIKVEYSLTNLGESLSPIMESMFNWGMEHKESFAKEYNIVIDENLEFPK